MWLAFDPSSWPGAYWTGTLDSVRICDGALNAGEVRHVYTLTRE
jgi:hypothetical protein